MRSIQSLRAPQLATLADTRVPLNESCRNMRPTRTAFVFLAVLAVILVAGVLSPLVTFAVLAGWAILTLACSTIMKITTAVLHLRGTSAPPSRSAPPITERMPVVSIMIPLFKAQEIAGRLLERLKALEYPHELLDILLVLEEDDDTTLTALQNTVLPDWIRSIRVPRGIIQTKPRALNYALDFCRGSIIGVYDAEDAPAPDQIRKMVLQFSTSDPKTVFLQGVLDFHNADSNWLAQCFTVEYAAWFRVILSGLSKLNLAIPLGGTTLFFRRDALEHLGGWDAHNVTEDADLGIRLARHGYQTELLASTSQEEANARMWPWIKQRSRWLKGYAVTYGVHMRNPAALWRDLGASRFFGIQLIFAGTLSQFLLAPLLWSFWLVPLSLPHPLVGVMPHWGFIAIALTFFASEIAGIFVGMIAVRATGKPRLMKWVPTLHLYYPLGAIASYKRICELARKPFYWDKTAHGIMTPTLPPEPPAHPVSDG